MPLYKYFVAPDPMFIDPITGKVAKFIKEIVRGIGQYNEKP